MRKIIIHIDFNSYFATVEQQANPRLRGKPIGVTGGDRTSRTVIGAASVEAKKRGVRGAMSIPEALNICPDLILVRGDSDKYLECTKRFLNILKNYSPYLEVFSIDEAFLELESSRWDLESSDSNLDFRLMTLATEIKERIKKEIGSWITCSIGISYNKTLAKLAGSLYKPNGLVVIADEQAAQWILDRVSLDEICGIGGATKRHLNNMGVFDFATLRKLSREQLVASFKSFGMTLYEMSRGIYDAPLTPFYEKEEVKSIGHQHTIDHDIDSPEEIKQLFVKLTELIARRLRRKKLKGKTVSVFYRAAFNLTYYENTGHKFYGEGMQVTISPTNDGLAIFKAAFSAFNKIWLKERIRMISVSVSNLQSELPSNLSFLPEEGRREVITKALDNINDRYGDFTLERGILLNTSKMRRMPNPFLSDRRFKI